MHYPVIVSAAATALPVLVSLGAVLGIRALGPSLPFHSQNTLDLATAISALVGLFGGGAIWGYVLSRIRGFPHAVRLSVVGGLSYGLGVLGAAALLGKLSSTVVAQAHAQGTPMHVLFSLVFPPTAFLVATLAAGAVLIASGHRGRSIGSALLVGLTAGLAFLILDVVLDLLGMRVGAPGAELRATMLTVAFLGSLGAALCGGAVLGRILFAAKARTAPAA